MGNIVHFKQKDIEDSMVELKAIQGGSTPFDGNWVSRLEIGTIFLAKDRTSADFILKHLFLVDKTPKSVKIVSPDVPTPFFIEPTRFCQKFSLHETLGVVKEEDLKKPDGENNESLPVSISEGNPEAL